MRVHRRQDMIIQTVAIVNPDLSVDFSNYWTAAMYFKHQNGSYKRVPIYPNAQLGMLTLLMSMRSLILFYSGYEGQDADHIKGGMTIYYTQKDFNSSDLGNPVRAFPPVRNTVRSILKRGSNWAKGFRMTVGNPSTTTINGTKKGLAYTCLQTILTRGYETPDFPKEPCPAGIMAIQVRDDLSRCCNQFTDHKTVSVSSILICRALRSCMIFA